MLLNQEKEAHELGLTMSSEDMSKKKRKDHSDAFGGSFMDTSFYVPGVMQVKCSFTFVSIVIYLYVGYVRTSRCTVAMASSFCNPKIARGVSENRSR
jgi:hypothetical protein